MNAEGPPPDPLTLLEGQAWALAAVVATLREAATGSLEQALAAAPARTAVLEAAGLAYRIGTDVVAHAALCLGPAAANVAAARLSSLRQAAAAAGGATTGWGAQSEDVLLDQGRASSAIGHALATRLVPSLSGLADRLATPGSRILDIGTGTAALALALARDLPQTQVTGIDNLERAIRLAHRETRAAAPEGARLELRRQNVEDLRETRCYDLVWLPAPFLSEVSVSTCLPHIVRALTDGGWLVVGTNPAQPDPLLAAVASWTATRNGGSAPDPDRMHTQLRELGLRDLRQVATVPGGPVLVAGQRAPRTSAAP